MKLKVTEQGVLIPKELLDNAQEVELIEQPGELIITIHPSEVLANQSEVVRTDNDFPVATKVSWQTAPTTKHYPLRGKPIYIANDFDEPIPELWEAS